MDKTLSSQREPHAAHSMVIANPPMTLSVPQQQALEWLTSGGSVNEAAQIAGVCRQTVSEWLHNDPNFTAAYQSWRQQLMEIARGRMAAMTETALDNVASAVRDKHNLQASQFVLRQLKVGAGK